MRHVRTSAKVRCLATRWDELESEGADFGLYPTISPARFLSDGEAEVQAAERHPTLRNGRMGCGYVYERERIVCTFGGAVTIPRIIATRLSRRERGIRMRYKALLERRAAEKEARARSSVFGEEFDEDARIAARRNTVEAARVFLARLNKDGRRPHGVADPG